MITEKKISTKNIFVFLLLISSLFFYSQLLLADIKGNLTPINEKATSFKAYGVGLIPTDAEKKHYDILQFNVDPSDLQKINKAVFFVTGIAKGPSNSSDPTYSKDIIINNIPLTGTVKKQYIFVSNNEKRLRYNLEIDAKHLIIAGENSFVFRGVDSTAFSGTLVLYKDDEAEKNSKVYGFDGMTSCYNQACSEYTINFPHSDSERTAKIALAFSEVQEDDIHGGCVNFEIPHGMRSNFISIKVDGKEVNLLKNQLLNSEGMAHDLLDWKRTSNSVKEPIIAPIAIPAGAKSLSVQPITTCSGIDSDCQDPASIVWTYFGAIIENSSPNSATESKRKIIITN